MDAKTLFIYDFDNFENQIGNALYERESRVFVDDENGTAHKKLSDYLSTLAEVPYLGWDSNVYPKFVVKDTTIY